MKTSSLEKQLIELHVQSNYLKVKQILNNNKDDNGLWVRFFFVMYVHKKRIILDLDSSYNIELNILFNRLKKEYANNQSPDIAYMISYLIIEAKVNSDITYGEKLLLTAAKQGNSMAQNFYAVCHWDKNSVFGHNPGKCVKWLKIASKNGHLGAQSNLGTAYSSGFNVKPNKRLASFWLHKAARAGQLDAQFNLANNYSHNESTKRNHIKATKLYLVLAKKGHMGAQNNLGLIYDRGQFVPKNHKRAFFWYHKAAEAGQETAQYNLAMMYEEGKGVKKDFSLALKWYQKAAELKHASAQYKLGIIYEKGLFGSVNLSNAVLWFENAKDNGHLNAQFKLATYYENGVHYQKNYNLALELYLKGANEGHIGSMFNLAYSFEKGDIVEKNPQEAILWYEKAASKGHLGARNNLGIIYEKGEIVERNYPRALSCYIEAAESGYPTAQFNLALAYKRGVITNTNIPLALSWFHKSAEAGYASAQYNLGNVYDLGEIVDRDIDKAFYWYELSAKNGYKYAQFKLYEIYKDGTLKSSNQQKSLYWLRQASKNEHSGAKTILAKIGLDTNKANYDEEFSLLEEACSLKDKDACYALGNLNYIGYRVVKNLEKASQYFQKAIDYGFADTNLVDLITWENGKSLNDDTFLDYGEELASTDNDFELFNKILQDLKNDFGENWEKLRNETKVFISNSFYLYGNLKKIADVYEMDYSPVVISLTKGLESELYYYFFEKYADYIEKYNLVASSFKYDERVIFFEKDGKRFSREDIKSRSKFTLGSINRIMNVDTIIEVRDQMTIDRLINPLINDETRLKNMNSTIYEKVSTQKNDQQNIVFKVEKQSFSYNFLAFIKYLFKDEDFKANNTEAYLLDLKQKITTLNDTYRIKAAHRSTLSDFDARFCISLIIKKHKLLQSFISKIKIEHLPQSTDDKSTNLA